MYDFSMQCKIESIEIYNGKHYHNVIRPSSNEFDKPSKFRIRADYKLGEVGSIVNVDCQISGSVFAKPFNDKNTGQPRVYHDVNVNFDAVISQSKPKAVNQ